MCENIFKNEEKKQRKEDFTKLFVSLVTSNVQSILKKQPKAITKS